MGLPKKNHFLLDSHGPVDFFFSYLSGLTDSDSLFHFVQPLTKHLLSATFYFKMYCAFHLTNCRTLLKSSSRKVKQ